MAPTPPRKRRQVSVKIQKALTRNNSPAARLKPPEAATRDFCQFRHGRNSNANSLIPPVKWAANKKINPASASLTNG
jgi:hypothetical protein